MMLPLRNLIDSIILSDKVMMSTVCTTPYEAL